MAEALKRLGATTVVANTDTSLYTVPATAKGSVISILACNHGATDRTIRVAHVDSGLIGAVASEDYVLYDAPIEANGIVSVNVGIAMSKGDTILVRANHADVSFIAWGPEIT